jgi:DNA-binding transcriptional LysR family regulator
MNSDTLDWELLRSFRAVLAEGSLSGAARTLGQTQPTIGRHIAELEAALGGVALFVRSPRGLVPTEAGEDLRPYADAMAAAAEALLRTASGERDAARGVVRITASEMVGAHVLPPILAAFRRAHPEVVVELVLSNRTEDLLQREADIAIRMVRPTQGALLARSLGDIALGLHGHPDYLAEFGTPRTLADLRGHAMIGYDQETPAIRALIAAGMPIRRETFALRTDSDPGQYAMIAAGFGLGVCQYGLARRDGLVPVLADQFGFDLPVWIVMHEDLKAVRRMRLLFDALAEGMSAYIATSRRG